MKISSLLHKDNVFVNLVVKDKQELIVKLTEALRPKAGEKTEMIRDAVLERESVMSTGVGKSLAIPHAKIPDLDENIAAFAKLKNPIEYGSIDNQPVEIVFLLVGDHDKASIHIKLLSKISRMMNNDNFRNQLLQAKKKDDILELFSEEEPIQS